MRCSVNTRSALPASLPYPSNVPNCTFCSFNAPGYFFLKAFRLAYFSNRLCIAVPILAPSQYLLVWLTGSYRYCPTHLVQGLAYRLGTILRCLSRLDGVLSRSRASDLMASSFTGPQPQKFVPNTLFVFLRENLP